MVRLGKTKVTQSTLAEALQLSRNTVARVLNNQPGVAESTRKAVLDKAYELGYALPGTLDKMTDPTAPQKEVAFLGYSDFLRNPFWIDIFQGFEQYMAGQGIVLRLALTDKDQVDSGTLPASLRISNVNGIAAAGTLPYPYYQLIQSLGLPMVTYDISSDMVGTQSTFDIISLNNDAGIAALTDRLIDDGFRHLTFAGDETASASFAERRQGFLRTMCRRGLTPISIAALNHLPPDASNINIKNLIQELADLKDRPDAYICANDSIAMELLSFRKEFPALLGNTAITSFDNTLSAQDTAALFGTVDPNRFYIGRTMAMQLCARIKDPASPPVTIRLNTQPLFLKDMKK